VDSDFAILEMYNGTSSLTDMVLVGDGSGYGFEDGTEFKGKKEAWEPLLTENNTWEQLSEIWNGDYVFTEEALSEMAPLLGMDSENILSDYDDLSSRTDKNIVELHFKKADKKKALSLNAAFIQVFGEALEPLGFVKIKSKYPYFVRVVEGGEIIHVITFRNERAGAPNYKAFDILGGVATVYRQKIDLTINPMDNLGWLSNVSNFYSKPNTNFDREFWRIIRKFPYRADDDELLIDTLKYSLELTEKFMLPIFDKATNLNDCIEYFRKFGPSMNLYNDGNFGNSNPNHYCYEGLLYIKTNNQELKKKWGKILEEKTIDEAKIKQVSSLYEFFNDPELHAQTLDELERRKKVNTEILRSYGLEIK
jgi:hypothetical protein